MKTTRGGLLLALYFVFHSACGIALTPQEHAYQLRLETEWQPADVLELNPFVLPRESIALDIGPIFAQGNTQFCWAYAALHMLRTFYLHDSEASSEWRDFFAQFDSSNKYLSYLRVQTGSTATRGWSIDAPYFYEKTVGSPIIPKWASYTPSETKTGWHPHPGPDLHSYTPQTYFTPRKDIIARIRSGLLNGAPTAYCTPDHCVTIYGGEYSGENPTRYTIADSAGGYSYYASPSAVHAKLADIMAVGP